MRPQGRTHKNLLLFSSRHFVSARRLNPVAEHQARLFSNLRRVKAHTPLERGAKAPRVLSLRTLSDSRPGTTGSWRTRTTTRPPDQLLVREALVHRKTVPVETPTAPLEGAGEVESQEGEVSGEATRLLEIPPPASLKPTRNRGLSPRIPVPQILRKLTLPKGSRFWVPPKILFDDGVPLYQRDIHRRVRRHGVHLKVNPRHVPSAKYLIWIGAYKSGLLFKTESDFDIFSQWIGDISRFISFIRRRILLKKDIVCFESTIPTSIDLILSRKAIGKYFLSMKTYLRLSRKSLLSGAHVLP